MRRAFLAACLVAGCGERAADPPRPAEAAPAASEWTPREGGELIGQPAPEWPRDLAWLDGTSRTLPALRGQVVLIRFWTDGCPFCVASAPALNELHARFAADGLVVLGFHHPKSERSEDPEVVRAAADRLGFRFPVALDTRWIALRAFWYQGDVDRRFTSSSFLIDRKGVIRWLHDGGEFHAGGEAGHEDCAAALASLESSVRKLLAER